MMKTEGKGQRLDLQTAALVVVDVQHGFVNEHSRPVLPMILRLVDGWRSAGGPMVFSRFHNEPDSPYERITGWTKLRTSREQALVEELEPYVATAAALIDKPQSSVFTTEGTEVIRDAGWTDLVFCGIDTDACVYDSAVAAYHNGIRPWIVTDACASTGGPQYHDAALLLASRNLGAAQLLTVDNLLDQAETQGGRA